MADINKFQRSKDKIKEILSYLKSTTHKDEKTNLFISKLQRSIQVIDKKMDEFKRKGLINN